MSVPYDPLHYRPVWLPATGTRPARWGLEYVGPPGGCQRPDAVVPAGYFAAGDARDAALADAATDAALRRAAAPDEPLQPGEACFSRGRLRAMSQAGLAAGGRGRGKGVGGGGRLGWADLSQGEDPEDTPAARICRRLAEIHAPPGVKVAAVEELAPEWGPRVLAPRAEIAAEFRPRARWSLDGYRDRRAAPLSDNEDPGRFDPPAGRGVDARAMARARAREEREAQAEADRVAAEELAMEQAKYREDPDHLTWERRARLEAPKPVKQAMPTVDALVEQNERARAILRERAHTATPEAEDEPAEDAGSVPARDRIAVACARVAARKAAVAAARARRRG